VAIAAGPTADPGTGAQHQHDGTHAAVGSQSRLATLVRDYLPAISAVGVVLYGLFRIAYAFFYFPLRTTPEEVGYTYTRVIAESLVGAIELILISTVLLAALAATAAAGWVVVLAAWRTLRQRRRPLLADLRVPVSRRSVARISRWIVAVAVVGVFLCLPVLARWQGSLAQSGQTVRNVYFVGVPYLPVLAVQAVPATVAWKAPDGEKAMPLKPRTCLLYLGKADGTAVFYDVANRDSVRLPAGDIVVTLRYEYFLPQACTATARKNAAAN
jgi:hypothetical protein